jgi:hypothetical protein
LLKVDIQLDLMAYFSSWISVLETAGLTPCCRRGAGVVVSCGLLLL